MCFVLTSILCVSAIFAESLVSLACVSSETHNLQRVFRRIQDTKKESLCRAFLAETVETETKNRCVIEATLDLELFRNVLVHECYGLKALITSEQVNTTEWSEKTRILISKTAMIGCKLLLLLFLVMSMRFIFGDD